MAFQVKTMAGAHGIPGQDHAGEPMSIICMLHDIMWLLFNGILGSSLSYVLTVFSLCFRYSSFQLKELGTIADTHYMFSTLCELH